MLIYAIDEKQNALKSLYDAITAAVPFAYVEAFSHPLSALRALQSRKQIPFAVFMEIQMSEVDGIELSKRILNEIPRLKIIFVTDTEKYMKDAFATHASGYLMKPVQPQDIHAEIEHLFITAGPDTVKRVQVQTFGNFEVRIDGEPVKFTHRKTMEYMAYLVDRRTTCTNKEIAAALWERNVNDSYIRKLRKDLKDTLNVVGCDDIFFYQPKRQWIRPESISCDYYDWLKGIPYAIRAYRGEYMTQYSWAEFTHGALK